MTSPRLRLMNALRQGQPAIATFMALKGMRTAQVVARTGLDVSILVSAYKISQLTV